MVKLSLTAVFEPVDEGWTQARIAEIPGVITAAPSRKEAQEMLLDALREYFLSFQEKSPTATQGLDSSRVEILLTG